VPRWAETNVESAAKDVLTPFQAWQDIVPPGAATLYCNVTVVGAAATFSL
jgi:hypothetical protein